MAEIGVEADLSLEALIIRGADADEDAGVRSGQTIRRNSSVLEGFPGHKQEHALLGVHGFGFAWRNTKELSVEIPHFACKATPF